MSRESASFRDPSGFVFTADGVVYRQINKIFADKYDQFMSSGLYGELVKERLLIPHQEIDKKTDWPADKYKVLKPDLIPFISYPYEWSLSQLKDAALLTLAIQQRALARGMTLKDASAYNIQFLGYRPIFIDTLSFEPYQAGRPWIAYRQFCQHFLAPLALMGLVDLRLAGLLKTNLDGIPLDLVSRLLPMTSRFSPGLAAHIHLHAQSQTRLSGTGRSSKSYRLPKEALLGMIDSLEKTIQKLSLPAQKTEWQDYYDHTNYSDKAEAFKKKTISGWLKQLQPKTVYDMGANTGEYSRLASQLGALTISSDIDPIAVERNYRQAKAKQEENLLPLVIDLTNPSPAIGWANAERSSFLARGSADTILCLALIHHLAISHNVPLKKIAELLHGLGKNLIIEFIGKDDSNVQRLLASREDIFPGYTEAGFEAAFKLSFIVKDKQPIPDSHRTLYLLQRS